MIPKPGARFVDFPEVISPAEFAKRFGWSERRVRSLAREIGAWPRSGQSYDLTKEDVDAILKATKPVPLSPQVRLQTTSYEDLVKLRTKQAPKAGTRRRVRCPRKPKSEG